MTDFGTTLFEKAHDSQTKFDYFLCSVAGALFAFIAQTYTPQKLDSVFSILQSASLIMLAMSFYCGIKRIQTTINVTRINQQIESHASTAKSLLVLLNTNQEVFKNETSGERADRGKLKSKHEECLPEISEMQCNVRNTIPRSRIYSLAQLNFLFGGFLLILTAKFLQPYQSDFHPPTHAIIQATNMPAPSLLGIQTNKPAHP